MRSPRLVGMIHLPPLPGSPAWDGQATMQDIVSVARADASVLQEAGFDGVLVQNSLDRPTRERVDGLAIAQLTAVTAAVIEAVDLTVGVNIVKNDGPGAMAIAIATGAAFVRVKVLTGAVLSAEGILVGCADETHRVRGRGDSSPAIWADVYEPTSRPLLADDFDAAVADAFDFGLADAVIVTKATTDDTLAAVERARQLRPEAHLVIGGRMGAETVQQGLALADTLIIGTALKVVPGIRGRVDLATARAIAERLPVLAT